MLTAKSTPKMSTTSPFYLNLARHSGTALISEDKKLSYVELETRIQTVESQLKKQCITATGQVGLLALPFAAQLEAVIYYLAALRLAVPVLLVDPELATAAKLTMYQQLGVGFELQNSQLKQLKSDWQTADYQQLTNKPAQAVAVMLSTSGSSGSPKAVMLTAKNICANTESITQYLPIKSTDVAITTLPLHYSYGLSVLNTHLTVGATITLTEQPLMSREFWQLVKTHQVTSLAGVPFHYQMLQTLRLERMELPSLRYLTQAGGKLNSQAVTHFAQLAADKDWKFFVMYGQTEATARMAYVPAELITQHPEVIGQAIPGGRFEIRDLVTQAIIKTPLEEGELYYFGDNVMLGYAEKATDWMHPPAPKNTLATGDLACWTEEGLIKITGRLSRFIKIRGKRFQLDHLEQQLKNTGTEVYCCGLDDQLFFAYLANPTQAAEQTTKQISEQINHLASQQLALHPSLWQAVALENLPYLSSGKLDYSSILTWCLKAKD